MMKLRSCSLSTLAWLGLVLCISRVIHAGEADNRLSTEAIINLPNADAWALFTSDEGLKALGFTQASINLQLGGRVQASGGAVALSSLDGEIISIDAGHMLSFKPTDSPANNQWGILYFTAMGKDMTQLRWLEFFPENQRAAATQHQQQIRRLFDQLIRRYAPECELCKLERQRN